MGFCQASKIGPPEKRSNARLFLSRANLGVKRETLMSIEESFFCHAVFRRAEIAVKAYMGRDFAERFFHFGCFDRFQHRHDGWRRVQMYTGAVIGAQPFATEVNS